MMTRGVAAADLHLTTMQAHTMEGQLHQQISEGNQPLATEFGGYRTPLTQSPLPAPLLPQMRVSTMPTPYFPPPAVGVPLAPADRQGIADWLKNNLPPWLQKALGMIDTDTPADPAPVQRSERRSAYAADILAGDANLWKDGIKLDAATLQDIVDHPEAHEPDTLRAAQILLNHPEQLAKIIAGANGSNPDGTITPEGLAQYSKNVTLQTPPAVNNTGNPSLAWQRSADAAEILAGDENVWQGKKSFLDIGDLKDIANHPEQHSSDTVHAAQVMLRNLPQFSLADGINTDGVRDGEIWRQDLTRFATSAPVQVPLDQAVKFDPTSQDYMQRALAAVAERARLQQSMGTDTYSGSLDPMASMARQTLLTDSTLWQGKTTLTPQDLANVLLNPVGHTPATVNAAMYMLTHPTDFHNEDAASGTGNVAFDQAIALQIQLAQMQAQLDAQSDPSEMFGPFPDSGR